MTVLLGTAALLATLAWLAGVVWFLRFFRAPAIAVPGRVTLLLAVTGRTAGLPALFAALARQTLCPRRIEGAPRYRFASIASQIARSR